MTTRTLNGVKCPNCGTEITLDDVLAQQFREENEARVAALAKHAEEQAHQHAALEMQYIQAQLAEERNKRIEAQKAELELRLKETRLDERERELDLEVLRRTQKAVDEQTDLRLREKDKTITDLQTKLDEAKRVALQGSMQRQGEVLELDIEEQLGHLFPYDLIAEVPKGKRGADIVHTVRNHTMRECGAIVWEMKNTKHWQASWIDKAKQDRRAAGAKLAAIISVALPPEIAEFGRIDGVWVTSLRTWPALALALREQLIDVAGAQVAAAGKHDNAELLYDYIAGSEFKGRIETLVEAFKALLAQLDHERAAMERLWREREKQIKRLMFSTAQIVGDIRGITGPEMLPMPVLELNGGAA